MAFLNDIDKKLSKFGQGAIQKGKDVSEVVRISGLVRDEESYQTELYRKIGEYFVQKYAEEAPEEMREWCEAVLRSKQNVLQYQEQIRILKGVACCPNCNAEVPANASFCNVCGAKIEQPQPTPVAPAAGGRFCPTCNAPVEEGQAFCMKCGTKIPEAAPVKPEVIAEPIPQTNICPNCGKEVKEGQKFCTSCGTPM